MLFGVVGRTGPGMRQVVGFGDRSTRRGTFGANFGRASVHRDLLGVRVLQRRDGALLPNYFGQTCLYNFIKELTCIYYYSAASVITIIRLCIPKPFIIWRRQIMLHTAHCKN